MEAIADLPHETSKARRFLHSYFGRIRVALILIVVISSCIWWPVFVEYQKEDRIAQEIWNAGGSVGREGRLLYRRIHTVELSNCKNPGGLPKDINELRHLQQLDLTWSLITDADLEYLRGLDKLETLLLSRTQVSDSGLENLKGLTKLRDLDLSHTQISDAGLEHLKGMNIRRLDLWGTAVTEAGLEHLKGLPNLTSLTFVNMQISNAGLEHLKSMTNLKRLMFKTTPSNLADLQEALPNCTFSP